MCCPSIKKHTGRGAPVRTSDSYPEHPWVVLYWRNLNSKFPQIHKATEHSGKGWTAGNPVSVPVLSAPTYHGLSMRRAWPLLTLLALLQAYGSVGLGQSTRRGRPTLEVKERCSRSMGEDSPRGPEIQEHGTKKSRCNKGELQNGNSWSFFLSRKLKVFLMPTSNIKTR